MRHITTSAYTPTEFSIENISDTVAKVSAWPFEIGYAITLAHPLRRLLYSSTVGFAPTGVKIKGVAHEFDSMRGMLEDVALFIINLKKLRFKLKTNSEKEIVTFSFKGPKEICGKDLDNEVVEVVNADSYLATINEDADLEFTLIIEKGIGYVPSEEVQNFLDPEFIALDAFFTPVKHAVYDIEKVLFEDNPDYEKVVFTITTDGQISPSDAFKNALEAMYKQLSVFDKIANAQSVVRSQTPNNEVEHVKLLQNITELNLSARSFNCLEKANVVYIGELALMSVSELADLKNLGKKSLDEIKSVMESIGFPIGNSKLSDSAKETLKKKIIELKAQNEG
ncbi:DNA-directed RNA polymerase, alpha subunit [Campylobacter subantarcticus LMG 24377]|uniref:DNA-directed RNA polymerase subunit alpha n=2 Tax=Campylobacter subantarcticus TaxID=497724 RepID=A0A0A8H7H6_9BACT|nr:DNA-directed RNA polymerase subunit alpha [Campylobacter subantarcticus]EAJ1260809.1 DNA-directed RNA polymerase subunit alpha [Campylobacter lari]AJC90006.1 DNA-directed RNA polymerase, alpha subunit [Campylobacter subantarcticus LMG 24374]AJC91673.1 DNA-directed RNA polymerase, alpha subunit [Campylobacter subantarcticus LMG 24377]EAL3939044.1 DNA-directed RNA polymerase subunit alpha [Campylobacter lari]MPB98881.1 DNA-directed RNA polymerase subunit alpha [Campylobacter subantarcticus]